MRIDFVMCPEWVETKLNAKHRTTCHEARQVSLSRPRIRFAERGHTEGEDMYAAFGRTRGGRYLAVFFIYKLATRSALIISARDMSEKERKAYERK